jgi:hypothetical protein
MLDDIIADDIAQGIRIPIPATQDRLLPPWARIACGLSAHPTSLALLISKQTFQKQASILRNTLLPKQWTYPLLDLPKRRRPQRKRLFNRRCPRPRCSNHGCPWIQKTSQKATVLLGWAYAPAGRAAQAKRVKQLTGGTHGDESWQVRSKHRKYSKTQAEAQMHETPWVHLLKHATLDLFGGLHIRGFLSFALLGFVYLKTDGDLTSRSDRVIASQMGVFAGLPPERRLDAINEYLKQDPSRVELAGLFVSNGRRIAGNLESLPPDLKTNNTVQSAVFVRIDESGRQKQAVRLTG